MIDDTLDDVRQRLSQLRAQLTVAETVLARICAHDDPQYVEREAMTRQLVELLSARPRPWHSSWMTRRPGCCTEPVPEKLCT